MGWSGGEDIARRLWFDVIWPYIPRDKWLEVGKIVLGILEDHDWDTMDEEMDEFWYWIYLENECEAGWIDWDKQELKAKKEMLKVLHDKYT